MSTQKPHSPASLLTLLFFAASLFGMLSRSIFFAMVSGPIGLKGILFALGRGLLFDAAVTLYAFIPIAILGLLPTTLFQKRWPQRISFGIFYVISGLFAFATLSEIFFVEEFHSRFNFIAVDYLVYTNEVVKNIWESYPIGWILPAFLVLHFLIARAFSRQIQPREGSSFAPLMSIVALGGAALCFFFFTEASALDGVESFEADLSKNPVHALFSAYQNNEIDYNRFYSTINEPLATQLVRESLKKDGALVQKLKNDAEPLFARSIGHSGPEKKLNVVIVLMESMSARFMKSFGADKNLTPNLDFLAQNGLFFDRVYSTGTRTVRGIEAVVLSVPPTPGQSIVRRPDSGDLYNIGTVLRKRGYNNQFVYGGHAFFDNMAKFFSSNGFSIYDETTIPEKEIHFSNAWGMCDEDLFRYAIKTADASKKPFFQFILTTSNHRPYSFPDGRINLPSNSGRDPAIKYSDFAIGKYIEAAKKKPWFDNTVFVFVADHNASVAGGTKILPADYRIPLIFYSPKNIKPQKVSILGSQIDLAPTLFGLLNFSYQNRFFGHDLLRAKTERAFLATYQKVALWQNNKLIMLSPNREIEIDKVNGETPTEEAFFKTKTGDDLKDPDVEDAVGFYEAASDSFREKLLKERLKIGLKPTAQRLR